MTYTVSSTWFESIVYRESKEEGPLDISSSQIAEEVPSDDQEDVDCSSDEADEENLETFVRILSTRSPWQPDGFVVMEPGLHGTGDSMCSVTITMSDPIKTMKINQLDVWTSALAMEVRSDQSYIGTYRADPNTKGKHGLFPMNVTPSPESEAKFNTLTFKFFSLAGINKRRMALGGIRVCAIETTGYVKRQPIDPSSPQNSQSLSTLMMLGLGMMRRHPGGDNPDVNMPFSPMRATPALNDPHQNRNVVQSKLNEEPAGNPNQGIVIGGNVADHDAVGSQPTPIPNRQHSSEPISGGAHGCRHCCCHDTGDSAGINLIIQNAIRDEVRAAEDRVMTSLEGKFDMLYRLLNQRQLSVTLFMPGLD